jgi:uncharacterized membrane protein (UPF0127 family)
MLLAGLVMLAWAGSPAQALDRGNLERLPRERIVLETRASGRHEFNAWRADTPQTRAQGLMYVGSLADDDAMIFIYDAPEVVSMWMKNTYVPLDMLFVDTGGRIVSIAERTRPLSLASIESGAAVVLVVELKAGTVASSGARIGDRIARPEAGWPVRADN